MEIPGGAIICPYCHHRFLEDAGMWSKMNRVQKGLSIASLIIFLPGFFTLDSNFTFSMIAWISAFVIIMAVFISVAWNEYYSKDK